MSSRNRLKCFLHPSVHPPGNNHVHHRPLCYLSQMILCYDPPRTNLPDYASCYVLRPSGRGDPLMFIAMNRFRVAKGSEAAFEQVWMSRDSHLEKVPGFVEFHLLKGPKLKTIRSTPPTQSGKTARPLKRGQDQRRSVQHIIGQGITSRCIWITHSSRGSRCARRWDAAGQHDAHMPSSVRELWRCPLLGAIRKSSTPGEYFAF